MVWDKGPLNRRLLLIRFTVWATPTSRIGGRYDIFTNANNDQHSNMCENSHIIRREEGVVIRGASDREGGIEGCERVFSVPQVMIHSEVIDSFLIYKSDWSYSVSESMWKWLLRPCHPVHYLTNEYVYSPFFHWKPWCVPGHSVPKRYGNATLRLSIQRYTKHNSKRIPLWHLAGSR